MKSILALSNILFLVTTLLADEMPSASLHPVVRTIVNADGNHVKPARKRAIERLPAQLSPHELEALCQFLHLPWEQDTSLTEASLASIKNDLAVKLSLSQYADFFAPHIVVMSDIPNLGPVWNGYCVQYFARLYPNVDTAHKTLIRESYAVHLRRYDDHRAGTALISIKNLLHYTKDFTADELCESAWRVYSADSVLDVNKLAAFQILGDLIDPRILRESRHILRNDTGDYTYKMSAMAILGKHGIATDIQLLEAFTSHADLRLRTAATRNLKTLKKRLAKDDGRATSLDGIGIYAPPIRAYART